MGPKRIAVCIWFGAILSTSMSRAQAPPPASAPTPLVSIEAVRAAQEQLRNVLVASIKADAEAAAAGGKQLFILWCLDCTSSEDITTNLFRNFAEVYTTWRKDKFLANDAVLTAVVAVGRGAVQVLAPTSDANFINAAANRLPHTAAELANPYLAIGQALETYAGARQQRQTIVILVTDKSTDRATALQAGEPFLQRLKAAKAVVNVIGPESMTGQFVGVSQSMTTGKVSRLRYDRGPETAAPELLTTIGCTPVALPCLSGHGPYDYVRLCRETGGKYFFYPLESQTESRLAHGYSEKSLPDYAPSYESRAEYLRECKQSPLRSALRSVCDLFTVADQASRDRLLLIPPSPSESQQTSTALALTEQRRQKNVRIAANSLTLCKQAEASLQTADKRRNTETNLRWLASFDLTRAELLVSQIQIHRFLIKSNAGSPITDAQAQALQTEAIRQLAEVAKSHPDTPFAVRAKLQQEELQKL